MAEVTPSLLVNVGHSSMETAELLVTETSVDDVYFESEVGDLQGGDRIPTDVRPRGRRASSDLWWNEDSNRRRGS